MQEQWEGAPHLNGNFLENRVQCFGFRYPKGRLHDFAMSPVRVTFTRPCLIPHRISEETSSHLPWSEPHHHLFKRQVQGSKRSTMVTPLRTDQASELSAVCRPGMLVAGGMQDVMDSLWIRYPELRLCQDEPTLH